MTLIELKINKKPDVPNQSPSPGKLTQAGMEVKDIGPICITNNSLFFFFFFLRNDSFIKELNQTVHEELC